MENLVDKREATASKTMNFDLAKHPLNRKL